MKFSSRVALVTGASHGIGAGVAKYLVKNGYKVFATYYKDKKLIETEFYENKAVVICQLDVGDEGSVIGVLGKVKEEAGKLDLLVNNAGVDYYDPIEQVTLARWEEVFAVRGRGTFLMTKYAIPLMKGRRTTIINITSSFAHEAQPDFPAVAAAEAAKMSFTKTCAVALAKYGIRTHSVNPGVTRTPLWDQFKVDDAGWKKMAKENPLGRNCTPEDIAKVILYLDSEAAEYLNGEEIYVNGGNHLRNL